MQMGIRGLPSQLWRQNRTKSCFKVQTHPYTKARAHNEKASLPATLEPLPRSASSHPKSVKNLISKLGMARLSVNNRVTSTRFEAQSPLKRALKIELAQCSYLNSLAWLKRIRSIHQLKKGMPIFIAMRSISAIKC